MCLLVEIFSGAQLYCYTDFINSFFVRYSVCIIIYIMYKLSVLTICIMYVQCNGLGITRWKWHICIVNVSGEIQWK